jgi:hypothetical protein
MKTKTAKVAPAAAPKDDDHSATAAAFAALDPELRAIPQDSIIAVNVDVQVAAMTAMNVARSVLADAALYARFHALATAKEFVIARLDRLEQVAQAAFHARHMYLLSSATHSEAQLPISLVSSATTVKSRMMKTVEYHLQDHEVAGPLVTAIRAGTGYLDLANDLIALGRLYFTYKSELEHDKRFYDAGDQKLALSLGEKIIALLGGDSSPAAQTWSDRQSRAWTRLNQDYSEVAAAGRFLKRNDAGAEALFPSLISASRAAARSAGVVDPAAVPEAPAGEQKAPK